MATTLALNSRFVVAFQSREDVPDPAAHAGRSAAELREVFDREIGSRGTVSLRTAEELIEKFEAEVLGRREFPPAAGAKPAAASARWRTCSTTSRIRRMAPVPDGGRKLTSLLGIALLFILAGSVISRFFSGLLPGAVAMRISDAMLRVEFQHDQHDGRRKELRFVRTERGQPDSLLRLLPSGAEILFDPDLSLDDAEGTTLARRELAALFPDFSFFR